MYRRAVLNAVRLGTGVRQMTAGEVDQALMLGIESSFDDSAVSLVRGNGEVLFSEIASARVAQMEKYGGVKPYDVVNHHKEQLPVLIEKAFAQTQTRPEALAGIAVTCFPGMVGTLRVGLKSATDLFTELEGRVPVYAVNHIEGHLLAHRLDPSVDSHLGFPFLSLVASGGHAELVFACGPGVYRILGTCLDDAPGEAFDKVARGLELDCIRECGGAAVERAAAAHDRSSPYPHSELSVPLAAQINSDFSFAGLKSAALHIVEFSNGPMSTEEKNALAYDFQEKVGMHLRERLARALAFTEKMFLKPPDTTPPSIVFTGGVARNDALFNTLRDHFSPHTNVVRPSAALCTDNASMIAWVALERLRVHRAIACTDPASLESIHRVPVGASYRHLLQSARLIRDNSSASRASTASSRPFRIPNHFNAPAKPHRLQFRTSGPASSLAAMHDLCLKPLLSKDSRENPRI